MHGVLRRLDDDWCDPLELRADSALGVPGLLQAVRAGHVVMANALGSAFLESPAMQGFLPGIARRLLGQELLLPALPTWWCGEAAAWHDVRAQLDDKIVRSTFPRGGRAVADARGRTTRPSTTTPTPGPCTERVRFSRAPVWSGGTVPGAPCDGARVRHRRGCRPMARAARRHDARGQGATSCSVSMQRGGSSLDTWVLTDGASG